MSADKKISRRGFLAATTTTAAAAATGCAATAKAAPVSRSRISANDKVNVGMIGLGGRCRHLAQECKGIPEMQIVAVCDCFGPRIKEYFERVGKDENVNSYLDMHEMIEKENLDAVMVETTTHARAWVTCHAMVAGLDVYIEKPMCLTIAEGRDMVNIARKYKRVTQVGTQQRSMPLNNWASDLVKNGAIGTVKEVRAPNFVSAVPWEPKPAQRMPDGGRDDWWDVWTNQAELRPYHRDMHRGWMRWWDYDGGGISYGVTGWGAHSYDQIQRGLGTDETGPIEVELMEPVRYRPAGTYDDRKPTDEETGSAYYDMVRKTAGPRAKVRMKYANGTELRLELDCDWGPGLGCIFVGEKGTIEINRDKISAIPRELIELPDRPDQLRVPEDEPHIRNWIECIKTRERCTADIEYGQRSSTICYLVNIARDVDMIGETLKWDPAAERFTNCDEANTMLSRPRRKGYELPT